MRKIRYLTDKQYAIILLLPALIIIVSVGVIPLVNVIQLSFTKTDLQYMHKHDFIGLRNYINIFTSRAYWQVVGNTFLITGIAVAGRFGLGLGLALLLGGIIIKRGKNLLRAVFILPWLLPGVAMAILWSWLLSTRIGIVNYLLKSVGLIDTNVPWLVTENLARFSVVTIFIWGGTPFIMMVVIAGLQTIPRDVIDAAKIDGAGYWSRFIFVIFPFLRSLMAMSVLLSLIYMFQNMAIIFTSTRGGPGLATVTFSLYVYETAFNAARIGRASAIGTTWLIFLLIFGVLYVRLMAGKAKT